jgi:hypothetical protein
MVTKNQFMKQQLLGVGGVGAVVLVLALICVAPLPGPAARQLWALADEAGGGSSAACFSCRSAETEAAPPAVAELTAAELDLRAALYEPVAGREPMVESGMLVRDAMLGCAQLVQQDHEGLETLADVARALGMCMSSTASRSRMPLRAWRALRGIGAHLAALPDHNNAEAMIGTAMRLAVLAGTLDANLVTEEGITLLHKAAHDDNLPMAEALLQRGALLNVFDARGLTPRDLARSDAMHELFVLAKSSSRFELLAEPTANCMLGLAQGGCDTLLCLTKLVERARRCVDRALRAGATANVAADDGLTLLHTAVQAQHTGWLQMLVDHGALVNTLSRAGTTPLGDARRANLTEAAAVLEAAGAWDPLGAGPQP